MTDFPRQYATSRRFTLGAPRNVRVTPDGDTVLFLRSERHTDPVLGLWALRTASRTTELLVDPKEIAADDGDLPPAELARRERARESASGIVAYTVDANGSSAAFTLGGDLYVVDIASGDLTPLATSPNVFDPVIDPSGRFVAFVADSADNTTEGDTTEGGTRSGLFVIRCGADSEPVLVADDSDPNVSWGRAEFVAAEEMSRTRGFWWSPDGTELIAQRTAEHNVDVWWIAEPAHPERTPRPIRYPAAGTTNANVQLARFSVTDNEPVTDNDTVARKENSPSVELTGMIDWADNGRFEYLATVVWTGDHDPLISRQTRDQRLVEIVSVDPSNDLTVLRTIEDPIWVELMSGAPAWAGERLLTVEDTSTARRLFVDGQPVTPEHVQVRSIVRADHDLVTITASFDDPTSVHVVDVQLASEGQPGELANLTTEPGVYSLARGGKTTVLIAHRVERCGTEITVTTNGNSVGTIEDLSEQPVLTPRPHFFSAGTRELRSAVFLPTDHDGVTAIPVLLDPYGGPHAQRVTQSHNPHLVSQWFADQGYAVLVTDGSGTPGRGPRFEREVWGDLAAPVLDDQIDALDAAAERFGCLDLERVGIRGWSFGGYLAALAALRRPDRIHAAIAGAPVTDWRLYDTHYTERYLGTPNEHPEHYERCDLTADAHLLSRPLMLIHGMADDNVVAAHTLQLSNALIAAGRAHQVLPLSGVTHMTPQEVVAENLLRLQLDFLDSHLRLTRSEI